MLIGIDGNEANQEKRVGVGQYSFQLLNNLYNQLSTISYQQLTFRVYLKEKPLLDLPPETDWWQYKIIGPKFFWTQIGLPLTLFIQSPRPDVFFTPTHYAPRFCPCPRVISIMDLSFLYYPQMFRKRDLFKLKNWTAYSVRKAKKILTISKATRDDIIKYYQIEPNNIEVVYPGFDKVKFQMSNVKTKSKISALRRKYRIEGDYILYVGTLQPRKNLARLTQAFNLAMKQCNNVTMKLVIVGKKGWMYQEIFDEVKKHHLQDRVIFTGYVPDKDLPALYKGAECFVLASLYEGFGLPALEALTYGVPVVVSNISSLPEVVGDAGILVDPHNPKDIARGIREVLSYNQSQREEMIKRGLKQAKKFSWEKCARETLKVLIETARS